MSERNEQATPKKRDEARQKGQVPRSREVNTAMLLLGSAIVVGPGADRIGRGLVELFARMATSPSMFPTATADASEWLGHLITQTLTLIAPALLTLMGVTVATAGLQARGVLSWTPLAPKWERLSPAKNAKRILGVQALAELAKSVLKLLIVGVAIWISLDGSVEDFLALSQTSPRALLEVSHDYAPKLLIAAGIAFLSLAGADYLFQLWQHEKGLRMSRDEIKRERKESDGDPLVRARIRSMGRALSRNRMIQGVAEADVVITNPTHIAIALKYDPSVAPAPTVVARGQRKIAERIKRIAFENGVPVIENKPLAWGLYEGARVGTVIPVELYAAVAEVLAFVFGQRRKARASLYRQRGIIQ